jgi:hypothetical protein
VASAEDDLLRPVVLPERGLDGDNAQELHAAILGTMAVKDRGRPPEIRLIQLAEDAGVSPAEVIRDFQRKGPLAKVLAHVFDLPLELGSDLGLRVRRGRRLKEKTAAMEQHYDLVERLRARRLKGRTLLEALREQNPDVKPESIIQAHQRYRRLKQKQSSSVSPLAKLFG